MFLLEHQNIDSEPSSAEGVLYREDHATRLH